MELEKPGFEDSDERQDRKTFDEDGQDDWRLGISMKKQRRI